MSNIFEQFVSSNQWIISKRNDQQTLINSITSQEFSINKIQFQKQNFAKLYQQRLTFNLPHTPKLILLRSSQIINKQAFLLVQICQYKIEDYIKYFTSRNRNVLEIVLQAVKICQMLYKKYGAFSFTENMTKATKGPQIILRINQNFAKNQPQFPHKDIANGMKLMLGSLFLIFQRKIPNAALMKILQQFEKKQENITFETIKKAVQKEIKENKKVKIYPQKRKTSIPQFLIKQKPEKDLQKQKLNKDLKQNKCRPQTQRIYLKQKQIQQTKNDSMGSTSTKSGISLDKKIQVINRLQTIDRLLSDLRLKNILESRILENNYQQYWNYEMEKQFEQIFYN